MIRSLWAAKLTWVSRARLYVMIDGGFDCLSRKADGEEEVKWLLQGVKFGRKALDSDIEYISFIPYILVPYRPLLEPQRIKIQL